MSLSDMRCRIVSTRIATRPVHTGRRSCVPLSRVIPFRRGLTAHSLTTRRFGRLYAEAEKDLTSPLFANIHDSTQEEEDTDDDGSQCAASGLDDVNPCIDPNFGGPDSLLIKTLRKCLKKRHKTALPYPTWPLIIGASLGIVHLWRTVSVAAPLVWLPQRDCDL